jgi:hypothetical protein
MLIRGRIMGANGEAAVANFTVAAIAQYDDHRVRQLHLRKFGLPVRRTVDLSLTI